MPRRHSSLSFKPFGKQTRKAQCRYWLNAKNHARLDAPQLGGGLAVDHYLFPGIQWTSGSLVGPRRPIVYQLVLRTARAAYADACINRALEESYALMDDISDGRAWLHTFTRTWAPDLKDWVYVRDPESAANRARTERELEIFGMHRYEWVTARAAELAGSGTISVKESIKLDHEFQAGIGVLAVLDYPDLDAVNLLDFARKFAESGYAEREGTADLRFPELSDPELLEQTQHSNGVRM